MEVVVAEQVEQVEQAVGVVALVVDIAVLVAGIVVRAVGSVQAENIVGTYNNTTDHTVVYNSIDSCILDNCSSIITFHIQ
ncbi:MAG: hypothetical protein V3U20_08920 [Thermoplasmata archaeon]